MTEDAEKRFERAMDRLFSSRSMSSPPTPASSSAGAASPPRQGKQANLAQHELGHGSKATSVSRAGHRPPQAAGNMNSPLLSPWRSSHNPVCRPWDRGDLLRRLATFKSITWFGKPKVAGPINCARKGWVNVDVDLIACEGCSSQLSFPIPHSWSQQQAESAAESFSQRLNTGHKALCPWRDNVCSETLSQFPPTPVQALIEGYKDRCDILLRLSALPVIASSAVDYLKLSRGSQIDSLLAQPPCSIAEVPQGVGEDRSGSVTGGSLHALNSSYYQSQKLISLCGWELRFLPYIVDCEDDSTQSARSIRTVGQLEGRLHRDGDRGPSVLLCSGAESLKDKVSTLNNNLKPETRLDPASAVLDCSLCGASVGLWSFATVGRPSCWINSVLAEPAGALKNVSETPACGISAASCLARTYSGDYRGKNQGGQPDETGEAVTSVLQKMSSKAGVLDLRLTIAGGPPPTQLSSRGLISSFSPPNPLSQPGITHPDRSEVGDWVGPTDYQEQKLIMGQVSSTTEKGRSGALPEDNAGCNSVDLDKDEVDDEEVGKGRGGVADSSECGHTGAFSQTTAVAKPGSSQNDDDGNEISKQKRKRAEPFRQSLREDRHFVEHNLRDHPRYSSVDAVDTCYHSRQENSMESVEMPRDADSQGTAVSGENNVAAGQTVQAQQSTCGQVVGELQRVSVAPGSSKSNECGDDGYGANVAAISTGTGKEWCVSVGMGSAKFDTSGSQDTVVHRSHLSVPRAESGVDEVDDVAHITENLEQTAELVHGRKRARLDSIKSQYQEAQFSTYSDQKQTSGRGTACLEGESVESGAKGGQRGGDDHILGEDALNKLNAGVMTDEKRVSEREDINTCMEPVKEALSPAGASIGITLEAGKVLESKISWNKESREFDPIRQHRHFCAWVNGNVTTAEYSSDTPKGALCGWQLTLDALDTPAAVVESESASSKYNVDPVASVRKILGSSSKPKKNKINSNHG